MHPYIPGTESSTPDAGCSLIGGISAPGAVTSACQGLEGEASHRLLSCSQLGRIVMLAAETGARFERDRVDADAGAWMFAPRELFQGESAILACRDELPFIRGMLLHGLSLGTDCEPAVIDELVAGADDVSRDLPPRASDCCKALHGEWRRMELYTATAVYEQAQHRCHVFHASMAFDEEQVLSELERRLGACARAALVRRGYDPSDPIVAENVSPAIAGILADVAADPNSCLGHGLNVLIEHRFHP